MGQRRGLKLIVKVAMDSESFDFQLGMIGIKWGMDEAEGRQVDSCPWGEHNPKKVAVVGSRPKRGFFCCLFFPRGQLVVQASFVEKTVLPLFNRFCSFARDQLPIFCVGHFMSFLFCSSEVLVYSFANTTLFIVALQ